MNAHWPCVAEMQGGGGEGGGKRQILLFPSVSKETKSTAAGQTVRGAKHARLCAETQT